MEEVWYGFGHIGQPLVSQTTALLDPATEAILKTQKALETHVFNLHIDPLRCTWSGCKNMTSFGKQGDLERHISSVHLKDNKYKCPISSCSRHQRGFPRKDKLKSHMRQPGHVLICCSYNYHNEGFLNSGQFLKHHVRSRKVHGNYKCSIGGCQGGTRFWGQHLKEHVRHCHGFTLDWDCSDVAEEGACY